MKLRILPAAKAEIDEASEYYDAQRAGPGDRYRASVQDALRSVLDMPLAWSPMRGGYRRCGTSPFPYQIIFKISGEIVIVVAVAHTSRRPGYWRGRI